MESRRLESFEISHHKFSQTVNKKQAPWVALGIMLGFAGGVSFVLGPFCLPAIRRLSAPYVPANDMLRNRIIQVCKKFEVKKMV